MKRLIFLACLIPFAAYAGFNDFTFQSFGLGGGICKPLIPVMAVSPTSKTFGNVSTSSTRTQIFTVTNTGRGLLSAIQPRISSSGVFRTYSSTGTTPPMTFKVAFTPVAASAYTNAVYVDNDQLPATRIALSGTGANTDPYTTYFASDWAGTGTQDTSNISGGVYSGWTSHTGTVDANIANQYVSTYSATTSSTSLIKSSLAAHAEIGTLLKAKFSSLSIVNNGNMPVLTLRDSTFLQFVLAVSSSGVGQPMNNWRITYYDSANSAHVTNIPYTFTADTDYSIDFRVKYDVTGSTGYIELWVNGAQIGSTIANISTKGATSDRVYLTTNGTTITGSITYDDFAVRYK